MTRPLLPVLLVLAGCATAPAPQPDMADLEPQRYRMGSLLAGGGINRGTIGPAVHVEVAKIFGDHPVTGAGATNGQALAYNSSTGKWQPTTISASEADTLATVTARGATTADALTFSSRLDLSGNYGLRLDGGGGVTLNTHWQDANTLDIEDGSGNDIMKFGALDGAATVEIVSPLTLPNSALLMGDGAYLSWDSDTDYLQADGAGGLELVSDDKLSLGFKQGTIADVSTSDYISVANTELWAMGGFTTPTLKGLSGVQGDVLYHNGTSWVRLGAGNSGEFLKTQGAAANPLWAAGGGSYSNGTIADVSTSDYITVANTNLWAMGGLRSSSTVLAGDGSASLPAHSFASDATTGMYLQSGSIRFAAGGSAALIVQGAGITALTNIDLNGSSLIGAKIPVTAAASGQALNGDTNTRAVYTNLAATAEATFTLPGAAAGRNFRFVCVDTDILKVLATGDDVIRGALGGVGTVTTSGAAGYIRSAVIGSAINLIALDATTWQVVSITGTWTIDL